MVFPAWLSYGRLRKVIGLLFRLLLLPIRLVLLPLKVFRAVTNFITCVVPVIVVIGIAVAIVWFLFIQ